MTNKTDTNDGETNRDTDKLRRKIDNLEHKIDDLQRENEELQTVIDNLERKNQFLQSEPQFVGTVEEIINDGDNYILRKHGDNQVFVNDTPDHMDLNTGERVVVNDTMAITEKIDQSERDARTKAMEVESDPNITFDEIGGLDDEIQRLKETTKDPLVNPEKFDEIGINPPSGVLLHGPPGTGKTMLAKAVANNSNATFLKLAASELARKFIGEGAKLVRDLFALADDKSPAIIFIDEIDAIATKRSETKTDGSAEVQRTLMQLLSEMDGFNDRDDIRIIAATNRFDMLDDAILRPGRFDRIIEVSEPNVEGREQIFKIHTKAMNIDDELDYNDLAENTEGLTGADIDAVCTEAGMMALRDDRTVIKEEDFYDAINKICGDDENSKHSDKYVY